MKSLISGGLVMLAAAVSAQGGVLFDNGGFITNPTGGTGSIAGLPISQCDPFQFPNNPSIFSTTGVGATIGVDTAVADDFTVGGAGWDLDSLTVFAYQSGQSTASVTTINVNLWTSAPYNASSPGPLPNPLPQPVLVSDLSMPAGSGTFVAHRESPTGTATNRPVFAYTVSLDGLPNSGHVDPGTYWLEWSFGNSNAPTSFVFTPLVTPRTITDDWNARLYNTLTGNPADPRAWFEGREGYLSETVPGRAYELPFVLNGTQLPEPGAMGLVGLMMLTIGRRRR